MREEGLFLTKYEEKSSWWSAVTTSLDQPAAVEELKIIWHCCNFNTEVARVEGDSALYDGGAGRSEDGRRNRLMSLVWMDFYGVFVLWAMAA